MRVGHVEGIVYAGNHGLQIFGRGMYFVEPTAAARSSELCRMSSALVEKLKPFMGAFVEFKGLTTAIHFRITPEENVQQISTVVRDMIATNPECFQLKSGSKVLEIVPRTNWNKGAAVRWINRRLGDGEILSIYIGDDNTDEDAFRELPDSITVKVGDPAGTLARYQAPDPDAVHDFLLRLTDCELSRSAGH
jgi:trehalose-phosphatase